MLSSYDSEEYPLVPELQVTAEQLRTTRHASPFQPFTIRMADGRQFQIPHPDFLSMSPTGRTAVVYHADGSASIVDLLLMTELELSRPASPHP
jgi:hypothetical protein